MRNLHSIITNPTAMFWATLVGRNGRTLLNGEAHLFAVERGIPPTSAYDREHFRIYRVPIMRAGLPLPICGPLRTRAEAPRQQFVSNYGLSWATLCPRCSAQHPTLTSRTNYHDRTMVISIDPWTQQLNNSLSGWRRPDPLTGL